MLHFQNLRYEYWAKAVVNALYTRNTCSTSALERMTFQQAWIGTKPYISHIKILDA